MLHLLAGGSYLYEIGWALYAGDVLAASGSGGESGYFSLNGDRSVLNGCTDLEAYNHNPLAIFDDGSCIYRWLHRPRGAELQRRRGV